MVWDDPAAERALTLAERAITGIDGLLLVARMNAHRAAIADRDDLIAEGVAAGMGDRAIAAEMGISHATVWRARNPTP